MTKGSILQSIKILNVYASNNSTSKNRRKTTHDYSQKQQHPCQQLIDQFSMDLQDLNNKLALIDTPLLSSRIHIVLQLTLIFTKIGHIPVYKTYLNFRRIEIIHFQSTVKLIYKSITERRKSPLIRKLNSTFLNNTEVKEKDPEDF